MTDLQAKYQKLAAEYAKVGCTEHPFRAQGQWELPRTSNGSVSKCVKSMIRRSCVRLLSGANSVLVASLSKMLTALQGISIGKIFPSPESHNYCCVILLLLCHLVSFVSGRL